jgi:hypothetical protein
VAYSSRVADLAEATLLPASRYHIWGSTNRLVRQSFVAAYHDQAPLAGAEQIELERGITAEWEATRWVTTSRWGGRG